MQTDKKNLEKKFAVVLKLKKSGIDNSRVLKIIEEYFYVFEDLIINDFPRFLLNIKIISKIDLQKNNVVLSVNFKKEEYVFLLTKLVRRLYIIEKDSEKIKKLTLFLENKNIFNFTFFNQGLTLNLIKFIYKYHRFDCVILNQNVTNIPLVLLSLLKDEGVISYLRKTADTKITLCHLISKERIELHDIKKINNKLIVDKKYENVELMNISKEFCDLFGL